jgi:uncharacterized protein YndB with AHSA1/START domain
MPIADDNMRVALDLGTSARPISRCEALARAVLLFHGGGQWTQECVVTWHTLTGADDATSRALCDFARTILAEIERPEAPG